MKMSHATGDVWNNLWDSGPISNLCDSDLASGEHTWPHCHVHETGLRRRLLCDMLQCHVGSTLEKIVNCGTIPSKTILRHTVLSKPWSIGPKCDNDMPYFFTFHSCWHKAIRLFYRIAEFKCIPGFSGTCQEPVWAIGSVPPHPVTSITADTEKPALHTQAASSPIIQFSVSRVSTLQFAAIRANIEQLTMASREPMSHLWAK